MVGKVIAAKAIGIFISYIKRIHFVINRLGRIKEWWGLAWKRRVISHHGKVFSTIRL